MTTGQSRGAVAAGHEATAGAAVEILREGGNAFDAVVAAHFAACVAEPVLASLGGGGYLMARPARGEPVVYDFFVHTPARKRVLEETEFHPIQADFGTVRQEFHIGVGAAAVPGAVCGLFAIHGDLGSLPMSRLVAPARRLAREGLAINALQAYLFRVIEPIYRYRPETAAKFSGVGGGLVGEGDTLCQPELADTLEALAEEGDRLFYEGDIARRLAALCENGGHLGMADLAGYRVERRRPLSFRYRGVRLYTNPPPASGGLLMAFALQLLAAWNLSPADFGTVKHLDLLARVMAATNRARLELMSRLPQDRLHSLLEEEYFERYRREISGEPHASRGTTHISVLDAAGNEAAMTVSNGEGCGYLIPGTGIMLNNMLGEEDLQPGGFHQWRENRRMTSMMSPTLVTLGDGRCMALGSGGSNRIRTALMQVISNRVDFAMTPERAVEVPRIHCERGQLDIEPGYSAETLAQLLALYPDGNIWQERNLFFGGVHAVEREGGHFHGVGDPRRGGVSRLA